MEVRQELVLDLDSTLIHSSTDMDDYDSIINEPGVSNRTYVINFDGYKMWGVFRPHLRAFLDYAHKRFYKVHIWSAGVNAYVHSIVNTIYSGTGNRPETVWSREMCEREPVLHKPLSKFFAGRTANEKNTFIIDDRRETMMMNQGNGILIPAYEPYADPSDISEPSHSLLKLIAWFTLPAVRNSTDVRTIRKDDIFTTSLETYQAILANLAAPMTTPVQVTPLGIPSTLNTPRFQSQRPRVNTLSF